MKRRAAESDWAPLADVVSKDILRAEVQHWAKRIGVQPREIRIRPMIRKWGSCSTAGRLTLSEALLTESARVRREVIVHELLHMKVPNHGKLFRALLKANLS